MGKEVGKPFHHRGQRPDKTILPQNRPLLHKPVSDPDAFRSVPLPQSETDYYNTTITIFLSSSYSLIYEKKREIMKK
jgi:hypothetical protein